MPFTGSNTQKFRSKQARGGSYGSPVRGPTGNFDYKINVGPTFIQMISIFYPLTYNFLLYGTVFPLTLHMLYPIFVTYIINNTTADVAKIIMGERPNVA